MDFVNATGFPAAYTMGLDPSAREHIVVVVKGTFSIPSIAGVAPIADEQAPLVFADTFTGEPGASAVVYESDFALHKPRCDVLLLGSAHAPGDRPTSRVTVVLQVGSMRKSFDVVGDRHFTAGVSGIVASRPGPFTTMPITYDRAFGGGFPTAANPRLSHTYSLNPVGVGYFERAKDSEILGRPLPNTEESGVPVESPKGTYRPMSLGPVGRNFSSRYPLAGTYDDKWLEENFPFLPPDFNEEYFQSAPRDQQIPYPRGGEVVQLLNLTPSPQAPFSLPTVDMPIEFNGRDQSRVERPAALDTIIIEPDLGRLQLVWRASLPLRRNIQEIGQLVVGRMPRGWYRARAAGKEYYPSLGHLVASKGGSS